uniref:AB hydrolase-1 domain-containing protein n=1 Tax=Aplanochytrium stocchinoi TaxID=215587 RepID=A0A7S3PD40_9STRA
MDPPGCGLSQHRPACGWYNDYEECIMMMQVADKLGWDEPFIICGHSRGSNLSGLAASVFRHRIRAALLIEGSLMASGCYITHYEQVGLPTGGLPLKPLIPLDRKNRERVPRIFDSLEDAIEHNRTNPTFPKARATAEGIATRHVKKLDDGRYQFTHDTRTYGQLHPHMIYPETNMSMRSNTACPVLSINIRSGHIALKHDYDKFYDQVQTQWANPQFTRENVRPYFDDINATFNATPDITLRLVAGKHHVHSDDPVTISKVALEFLEEKISSAEFEASKLEDIKLSEIGFHDYIYLLPDVSPEAQLEEIVDVAVKSLCEEFTLDVLGQNICVKRWGSKDAKFKAIAWCDEQDNAGSFDRLGEIIVEKMPEQICLIAVDRPGLGLSGHLSLEQWYDVGCEAPLLLDIADAFHWNDPFTIIVHDRAAAAGLMVAGALPERVNGLICLDYVNAASLPSYMYASEMFYCYEEDKNTCLEQPTFSSYTEAKKYLSNKSDRYRSDLVLSHVARRSLKQLEENVWVCTDDPRRRIRSPHPPNFETIRRAVTRIRTPVLFLNSKNEQKDVLLKEKPLQVLRSMQEKLFLLNSTYTTLHMDGSHYMHVDNAEECLQHILHWANSNNVWQVDFGKSKLITARADSVRSKL